MTCFLKQNAWSIITSIESPYLKRGIDILSEDYKFVNPVSI